MGKWTVNEIIECSRYGILGVYIKDDYRGLQFCRRIRRKKGKLFAEESYYMKLPKEYNNNTVTLMPGDLFFISNDKTVSILRNEKGENFAQVTNGRLKMNPIFFNNGE